MLLLAVVWAVAGADYIATLNFASEEPYDPSTSCSAAPAMYELQPVCNSLPTPFPPSPYGWNSTSSTCINRMSFVTSYFHTLDCSGPPTGVSPPQAVPNNWCKPSPIAPLYTATVDACMSGNFLDSSPASGLMTLDILLKTPDQLCPNPVGPLFAAGLTVQQPCTTDRTCQELGSQITQVLECVTAGDPVPPPSG